MGKRKILVVIGGVIGSYALHFPLRLFEDWVMGEMEGAIAENWQNIMSFSIVWVLPFVVVFGAIALGYWLKKSRPIGKRTGANRADYYSGYIDVGKARAGANLEVVAKVGDYTSAPVTTNTAGYYLRLEIMPPNDSYIGCDIEFYVEGKKASQTGKYFGGGHSPNFFNLEYESETKDKIEPIAKEKQKETASQIHNEAMGEHITRIVELLNIWKEQLSLMIEKTELDEIGAEIEKESDFYTILEHCPSVNKKNTELRLSRVICEAKLNPISLVKGKEIKRRASKQEIAEDKSWLNEKMQLVVDAIEKSLKSSEYTKTRCDWCPRDMLQS